jgi:hypothetical protein
MVLKQTSHTFLFSKSKPNLVFMKSIMPKLNSTVSSQVSIPSSLELK